MARKRTHRAEMVRKAQEQEKKAAAAKPAKAPEKKSVKKG